MARPIIPHYAWDDIVLAPDELAQLREICHQASARHMVYGEWGFDRKLSLGKGLNVLFSGPPGTGKTMAAEVIANELGLDLYKIDLSQVVSKYIGETEKNLDRIFSAAQSTRRFVALRLAFSASDFFLQLGDVLWSSALRLPPGVDGGRPRRLFYLGVAM